MNYIVVDFEWNQPRYEQKPICEPIFFDSEIIEFGAVMLDDHFKPVSEFRRFVKPCFYPIMNGHVSRLTKISERDVNGAQGFVEVFQDFCDWCGEEYALMTWGPTDIPVLMENLLVHGIPVDQMPVCYDLQRIFTHEVMREEGQCSLENAVAALNLPSERAHDALNDALNTARICDFLDLDTYLEEYRISYADYAQTELDHPVRDSEECGALGRFTCPFCGEAVTPAGPWVMGREACACGTCGEGDEFWISLSQSRLEENRYICKRVVVEMNDDIWDAFAGKNDSAK